MPSMPSVYCKAKSVCTPCSTLCHSYSALQHSREVSSPLSFLKRCFHKSLVKSLFYMVRDMGLICALWKAYPVYVEGNWPLTFVWWNAMGFMMWALFVVGHDCGHTTFSEYTWVNAVCGHLCHAPLLVPFWPWAQSHHQHHSYHNHVEKDHSFPWFRKEQYATQLSGVGRTILKTPLHPLFSYGVSYLFFGYWDGSHFNPFGSLFKNRTQRVQCAVSSLAVALFLGLFLHYVIEYSVSAFAVKYAAPWCIYNYWLVMVTYLLLRTAPPPPPHSSDDSRAHVWTDEFRGGICLAGGGA
eukprot:TRINITY_DN1675_c0_g1_i4.p1 TRINITY_DN1675_c0_g1~~TRINITY_DN1675_c0_g1_i4.p1  ORF type:complete len:297 (-),score=65.55 TRINITY_DN1675_c0_g1_i4:268-1158(-)